MLSHWQTFPGIRNIFTTFPIRAEVPLGRILGPTLYTLFIVDIPEHPNTVFCIFEDDKAILARQSNPLQASSLLQAYRLLLEKHFKRWRSKININKCDNIKFILCTRFRPSFLPTADVARYLGHISTFTFTQWLHLQDNRSTSR